MGKALPIVCQQAIQAAIDVVGEAGRIIEPLLLVVELYCCVLLPKLLP